ncbi:hypothetical protein AB0C38_13900 [Amycolatopsis sp. NPDC048633]|uniref:hypothetical protein n=1 Tax=Amycolatopsis sp. NPDC048633 TaxID=3157095 RepID=UPI0033DB1897
MAKERDEAVRARQYRAAKECEELCVRMADDSENTLPAWRQNHDEAERERENRVRETHANLDSSSLYLPDVIRMRVELLGNIVADVEDISYGSGNYGATHYSSPHAICWNVKREIRTLIADFIQGRDVSAAGHAIREYEVALRDLDEERNEFYSMIEADGDDEYLKNQEDKRKEFYRRHPELQRDQPKEDN